MDIISKLFQELTELKKCIEILVWSVMILTKIYKFVFKFIARKLKRVKEKNIIKKKMENDS